MIGIKRAQIVVLTFMGIIAIGLSGCASWFSKAKETVGLEQTTPEGESLVKFSENPTYLDVSNRQYRKTTRQKLEEDSELHAQAGSMWSGEGQSAYLFSQNKTRKEGDLLSVKVDGSAQKQIDTKVSVIKKLLKQLEEEEAKSKGQGAAEGGKLAEAGGADAKRAPAAAAKPEEKDEPIQLENVPTRIIERLADGNYRVKGQQPFMIGKREFKVIVTGLIRPEDFNDEGISSSKLLDPQYDVVSIRRREKTAL